MYRRRLSRGDNFTRRKEERKSNEKNERTICEKLDKDTGGSSRADSELVCLTLLMRSSHLTVLCLRPHGHDSCIIYLKALKNSFDLKSQIGKGVCPPRSTRLLLLCRCCLHRKWLPSPRYVRGCAGLVRVAVRLAKVAVRTVPGVNGIARSLGTYEQRR